MGNLDWGDVKGGEKGKQPQRPQAGISPDDVKGKLESPYRKGEDSGLDPKENHKAHDAVAGEDRNEDRNEDRSDAPAEGARDTGAGSQETGAPPDPM